jgi:hypothetical protein
MQISCISEDQTECEVESSGDEESVQSCFGAKRRFGAASRVQVDNGVIKSYLCNLLKVKDPHLKKTREKKTEYAHQREKNGRAKTFLINYFW